jgi:hypothetical protein
VPGALYRLKKVASASTGATEDFESRAKDHGTRSRDLECQLMVGPALEEPRIEQAAAGGRLSA